MWMFLLLLLVCLAAGSGADAKGKTCEREEVKFKCDNNKCKMDDGIKQGRKTRKLIIKHPEVDQLEFEMYDDCEKPFPHTAYRTGRTTIACNFGTSNSLSSVNFFCKDGSLACTLNSAFNLTQTSTGFNVTISQITAEDEGLYWCGVKENTASSTKSGTRFAALKKINLSVENISNFTRSWMIGKDYSFYCSYSKRGHKESNWKFICKGDDPHMCQTVLNSMKPKNGRFSMTDDKEKRKVTITMRELTVEDGGNYWCGVKNSAGIVFINKMFLTIVRPPSSTSASPLTPTTPDSVERQIIIPVVVLLVLLLVVTVSIFICKRLLVSRTSAAPNSKADHLYEDIRERPLMPQSDCATTTIYATAELPTMHSGSQHYAQIDFQRRCDGAAGASKLQKVQKDESCQYSTVKFKEREDSPC